MTDQFIMHAPLLEMVDQNARKNWIKLVASSTRPGVPTNPEHIRQLVDFVINRTDNINPARHTSFAFWMLKNYLDDQLQIAMSAPTDDDKDEDSIRQKLILFNSFCDNETPIPIKEWANPADQWNIKNYSKDDLFTFTHKVQSNEITTESEEEREAKEEAEFGTDREALANYRAKKQKERDLKNAVRDFTYTLYDQDGEQIILILGTPSLGPNKTNIFRQGCIAWWALAQGTTWCVGQGEYFSNTHGPRYLDKSDVLIYRKDGKSISSMQYEGHFRVRDPLDKDVFEAGWNSKSLEEVPCGNFTLLLINTEGMNRGVSDENKALIKRFIDLYPSCDVSASVTFNEKQLLVTDGDKTKIATVLPELIVEKIKSFGYSSIKEYILEIYPTVLYSQSKTYISNLSRDANTGKDIPGISEYLNQDTLKTLTSAGSSATYSYLFHLLFRYKDSIEKDILSKESANLAALYLSVLAKSVKNQPTVVQTPEFANFTFSDTL